MPATTAGQASIVPLDKKDFDDDFGKFDDPPAVSQPNPSPDDQKEADDDFGDFGDFD